MELIKSRKKESFINKASLEALKSPMLFRHGCIAVYGGKQIASGYNHYRTYSKDKSILNEYNCSMHSEVDCIRKIKKSKYKNKMKDISLYVVKVNSDFKLGNSKPCSSCKSILKSHKVKKVYYSVDNGFVCSKVDEIVTRDSFGTKMMKINMKFKLNL